MGLVNNTMTFKDLFRQVENNSSACWARAWRCQMKTRDVSGWVQRADELI